MLGIAFEPPGVQSTLYDLSNPARTPLSCCNEAQLQIVESNFNLRSVLRMPHSPQGRTAQPFNTNLRPIHHRAPPPPPPRLHCLPQIHQAAPIPQPLQPVTRLLRTQACPHQLGDLIPDDLPPTEGHARLPCRPPRPAPDTLQLLDRWPAVDAGFPLRPGVRDGAQARKDVVWRSAGGAGWRDCGRSGVAGARGWAGFEGVEVEVLRGVVVVVVVIIVITVVDGVTIDVSIMMRAVVDACIGVCGDVCVDRRIGIEEIAGCGSWSGLWISCCSRCPNCGLAWRMNLEHLISWLDETLRYGVEQSEVEGVTTGT